MKAQNSSPTLITLIWFACLSMLGFLSTDMYLPAFDELRTSFNTNSSAIGLSLSLFLLGMAVGQIIYGILSDRFGRKKILLLGLSLFCIATLLCTSVTNIELFLIGRFLQALGACSATVIWQAVVVDRYDENQGGKIFATIMPLVALSPALAPLLGAYLQQNWGWRSIFVFLIVFGGLIIALTIRESESTQDNSKSNWLSQLRHDYALILRSYSFWGGMIIFGACSAGFFAYLTGVPFIMHNLGYTKQQIGLSFIPQTIAFMIGGFACKKLLNYHDGKDLLIWLLSLFFISVILIFIFNLTMEIRNIAWILVPFCFLAISNGAIYPIVINISLNQFKQCGATASGLLNFLQTLICFIASGIVSALTSYILLAVTSVMLTMSLLAFIGYFLIKKA